MKFPHELSKERLSLLSPEDKRIYEMEHSGLYSFEDVQLNDNYEYIVEDAQIRKQMDKFLFDTEFDNMFDKEIIEAVGEEEYMNIKKNIFEFIENDPEMQGELFEAPGHSADWWMDFKMSWFGKLAAGLLTGLLGLIAWLIMKGKDRLAMKKLKQYMNKLVELIDQGVNKKRPWYSFLMISKKARKNTGDYNKACLRTIQETAERNMACLYTQCIHNLGFLSPNLTDFRGITSGMMPDPDSGLSHFADMISGKIENIQDLQRESDKKALLPIKPDLTKFKTLKLPALPTNYTMLMSDIEYPSKANKNPNGSLFMKPTKEILQAKASDLGLTYFNDEVTDILHYKKASETATATTEDYERAFDNPYIQMLLEVQNKRGNDKLSGVYPGGVITNDLDDSIFGAELDQHTEGKQETTLNIFEGNIIDAIDGYTRSSIPVVQKLVKAVCGNEASKNMEEMAKLLTTLLNAAEGKMSEYMQKYDTVLKEVVKNFWEDKAGKLEGHITVMSSVIEILDLLDNHKNKKQFQDHVEKNGGIVNFRKDLQKIAGDKDATDKELKTVLQLYGIGSIKDIKKLMGLMTSSVDTLKFNIYSNISEADLQHMNQETGGNSEHILNILEKTLDTTYQEVRNSVGEAMGKYISSDPSTWNIITTSKARMDKLKEAADKEITAKIELICRIAADGKSDLGDKFKSAISKHPIRAESLKRIWAMYSDDIQDRIETRLRSIVGDNGNSNILDTIKQFLINVYPNLIAIMIFYKSIFYILEQYTRKYPLEMDPEDPSTWTTVEDDNTLDNIYKFFISPSLTTSGTTSSSTGATS